VLVNTSTQGEPANGYSSYSSISPDGRYVVFTSRATNLVASDGNHRFDVFRHDRFTSETVRVSVSSSGGDADADSLLYYSPSVSADGRFVVFTSGATNLVAGDTNRSRGRVFLCDLELGQDTPGQRERATERQVDESEARIPTTSHGGETDGSIAPRSRSEAARPRRPGHGRAERTTSFLRRPHPTGSLRPRQPRTGRALEANGGTS
jgi:hypothetical protein